MKKETGIRLIFFVILFAIVLFIGVPFIKYVIQEEEKRECLKWQKEAKEIKVYFITPWQKEQCDVYGIKISAPVKEMKGGS